MLMEDFNAWIYKKNHPFLSDNIKDNFEIFYQENQFGKTFFDMLAELAYQIYEMQECIEGIIEDMDYKE